MLSICEKIKYFIKLIFKPNSPTTSINDFLNTLSPMIDEEVIHYTKENNVKPLGGQVFMNDDTSQKQIIVRWDFYFIDSNNKNIKISSRDLFEYGFFDENSHQQISNGLVFDINPPEIP